MSIRALLRSTLLVGTLAVCAAIVFASHIKTELALVAGWWSFRNADFAGAVRHLPSPIDDLTQRGHADRSIYYRQRLAQSYLALHRYDDALAQYRWLAQSSTGDSKALFIAALDHWSRREWDEASRKLKRAREQELKNTEGPEPRCPVCDGASKTIMDSSVAQRNIAEAKIAQARALEQMQAPALCLLSIAAVTAGSAAANASGIPHDTMLTIVRKAGATKFLTRVAIGKIERYLGERLRAAISAALCMAVSGNEQVSSIMDWVELVPYGQETRRAAYHALELLKLIGSYGLTFNAERENAQLLAKADAELSAYWESLASASTDPAFIDRGLATLAMPPAPQPKPGIIEWILSRIDPQKWF